MSGFPLLLIASFMAGCQFGFGQHANDEGKYPPLFPQTPLSEAPCLEDQDCVVSHLIDGACCPEPTTAASNVYTQDQYTQLVEHQKLMCNDAQDTYPCPEHPPRGHIEYVLQGACVNQRCVAKKVPADAPHIPKPNLPSPTSGDEKQETQPIIDGDGPIQTAASPNTD